MMKKASHIFLHYLIIFSVLFWMYLLCEKKKEYNLKISFEVLRYHIDFEMNA